MSKKIFIKTFGCQMNEYDSNRILDLVKNIGYTPTTNLSEADCYVLNTCHIREKATDKVYHDIGRVKKEFKNKKKPIVLITGCVAQAENEEMLKKENYIDGVIGPQSYHQIPKILNSYNQKKFVNNFTDFEVIEKFDSLNLVKNSNSKVSSFLTIQEGCDKFCHFCVVPYTRGPEYSRPFKDIINEAKQLIENGSKEITLLGQNVNAYVFKDSSRTYKISDLINELNSIEGLKRIRYTTSHPLDVSNDLIEAHKYCEKLMPLLHLPVQSGSSKILKSMNRKHNIEQYLQIIDLLSNAKPNIKFSSDFIISYPGENEEDFNQTINLVKKIKFINSFSFIFSARPGTPAAKLDTVNSEISKKRLIQLQQLLEQNNFEFKQSFLNQTTEVLVENKLQKNNQYFGRDRFLNPVIIESPKDITGKIINIQISKFNHNSLFGVIKNDKDFKEFAA
ncbi:MAG: tRNA (N6-isopentenyl adenosine(37)-C2)-methylthiotransferase MiaB [Pelagibacteraceae bacterium]